MTIFQPPKTVQTPFSLSGFITATVTDNDARYRFTISAAVAAVLGVGIAVACFVIPPQQRPASSPTVAAPIGHVANNHVLARGAAGG